MYRHPSEQPIFAVTLTLVIAVLALSAGVTVCLVPVLVGAVILISYQMNLAHHRQLMAEASQLTPTNGPTLWTVFERCQKRLKPGPVEVYVANSRQRNAYTFGISSPKVIVIYSGLLRALDADEVAFILGHECGHVALGHSYLNTLLGGMAGVPVSIGTAVVLTLAFRWWNRACEFSADRAGLIACGSLNKAITALVKLTLDGPGSQAELERALQAIEAEDDSFANVLANTLSTHPMLVTRIQALREYAATAQYRRLSGSA
jgi:Zn-dependent protease with chaperone function